MVLIPGCLSGDWTKKLFHLIDRKLKIICGPKNETHFDQMWAYSDKENFQHKFTPWNLYKICDWSI